MKVRKMKAKTIGVTGAAILCVVFAMSAPGYAAQDHQDDKHDQARPKQNSHQESPPPQQEAHQPQRQEESRPQQHDQHQQPDRAKQQQRPLGDHVPQGTPEHAQQRKDQDRAQHHPQQAQEGDHSHHSPEFQHPQQRGWQQHRANNWQSDHRTWRQRGGYEGYLIPDQHFRGYFGRDHGFKIGVLPFMVVGGYPRFQYGGYWFSSVDPWPEYWGDDWYDTDYVYVDYVDNGYYLFNRRYPGSGIAISVSM